MSSYFSPMVLRAPGFSNDTYILPNADVRPGFSIAPRVVKEVVKDGATSPGAKDIGKDIKIDDTEISYSHTLARCTSIALAVIATIGLIALQVVPIYFPAIVLPMAALMIAVASCYGAALLIAAISKVTIQKEVVQKPNDPIVEKNSLDPREEVSEIVWEDKGGGHFKEIGQQADEKQSVNNQSIKYYNDGDVVIHWGHLAARIAAVTFGVLAVSAAVALIIIPIYFSAIVLPISMLTAWAVIGLVGVTAYIVHKLSVATLKEEIILIEKADLLIYDHESGPEEDGKDADLYTPKTGGGSIKDGEDEYFYIHERDLAEIASYKKAHVLTKEYGARNYTANISK